MLLNYQFQTKFKMLGPSIGFWLKDPSRIEETTGTPYEVDYRTERYRLDDLLLLNKRRKNGYVGLNHEDETTH